LRLPAIALLLHLAWIATASPGTAAANPDTLSIASLSTPSDRELAEIQARFTFRGEARLSRQGLRSIVSHPRFSPDGIDYLDVIGEDGWPAAQTLPRPLRWAEVDTIWRRSSYAGIGAFAGAVVVAPITAAWGHHRWPSQEDAFLVIATGTIGAVAGGILGGMIGSAWFGWEPVRPAPP
jgi:hypothetical protein